MSYGIVRIQKMTSGSVRGIDIHDNRLKEYSHSNPDIDFSKSDLNYALKKPEDSFYNSVHERIRALDLPKAVRKDAVVMSQALVTSDKNFFDGLSKEKQESFFKKSYEFIENRYGKDNIISATVHLDEKTPHMHVNFVPVTSDGRLCAKDLLNRKEMQSLQNDAYKDVFKSFDLERGVPREEKRRHLSVEEFKIETKSDELSRKAIRQADEIVGSAKKTITENISKMQENIKTTELKCTEMLSKAHSEAQAIKDGIAPLKIEYEAFKAFIDQSVKDSNVSIMYPDYVKINKSLLGKETVTVPKDKWEARHVSTHQVNALQKEREAIERDIQSIKQSVPSQKIAKLEDELLKSRQQNKELSQKLIRASGEINRINKVFEKNLDIKDAFIETEKVLKEIEKQQSKSLEHER